MINEEQEQLLKRIIQDGLPLVSQPYAHLAEQVGATEEEVMSCLNGWIDDGLVKRLGLVVKHRALGYRANAMVVWDIEDSQLERIGNLLASSPAVTLCYQRPRKLPEWPYNLFCMIHGRTREGVEAQLSRLVEQHQLHDIPKALLFSFREFKQRGGRYFTAPAEATGTISGTSKWHSPSDLKGAADDLMQGRGSYG